MNDLEWRTTRDPFVILDCLFPMRGDDSVEEQTRSSRLYLVACARRRLDRLPPCARTLLGIAERVAVKAGVGDEERRAARRLAEGLVNCFGEAEFLSEVARQLMDAGHVVESPTGPPAEYERVEWRSLSHLVYLPFAASTPNYRLILPEDHSADLLRDVFANPFRDGRIPGDCRTRTVVGLAKDMDADGDYSRLRLLSDALADAGCRNEDALEHCHSEGPHVRGCWVVDAILHPPRRG